MPPQYTAKLEQAGRSLNAWQAEIKLSWGLMFFGGCILALSFLDVWLRIEQSTRVASWVILVGVAGATARWITISINRRFTPESIAVTLEKAFPHLDNRLINYLQLSNNPEKNPFKDAYVQAGVPALDTLDFRKMRETAKHRRHWIGVAGIGLLLLIPVFLVGNVWTVALWRIINPFSQTPPPSLTRILGVAPGDSLVVQGHPQILTCTVKGAQGHDVSVEIQPNDSAKIVCGIGKIHSTDQLDFTYKIPKVTTTMRYRFRAGDAENSPWFTINTRPPPALSEISVVITPPAYIKIPPRTANPLEGRLLIPVGSHVQLTASSNCPLQALTASWAESEPSQMTPINGDPHKWSIAPGLNSGTCLVLRGKDTFGVELEENLYFTLVPDTPPGIEIISPVNRAILPRGECPQIAFRVADDFGISEVFIEEVKSDAPTNERGNEIKRWKANQVREFFQTWRSESTPTSGSDVIFRIVATDNEPHSRNETVSALIVFNAPPVAELVRQQETLDKEARSNIESAIALQKQNIADTIRYNESIQSTPSANWKTAADTQTQIRDIVHTLLLSPAKPLGSLVAAVQKLYVNEMVLAVDALQSIPSADDKRKPALASEALTLETTILRHLSSALPAASKTILQQKVSGLSALLESILRNQIAILKQTSAVIESTARPSTQLIDAQDGVAKDMVSFVNSCKDEAAQAAQTDTALAGTLERMTAKANELKISSDMFIAAERLDQNQCTQAAPIQERVISGLRILQAMFEEIKIQEEAEKRELLTEAVRHAKEKLEKIEALNEKITEAMDQVKGQKDKNNEAMDEMSEDFTAMKENLKEALLEIPNDLHIFTELNVANDLVEDVFSVFQEIEQKADNSKDAANQLQEIGAAKDEKLLKAMGEAKARLDAMEMWLSEKPDKAKITAEAFDKAEMPESGIALGELAAAAQDLLGDLLKEDEKMAAQADDSATNHAMSDVLAGAEVAEGDISSFGAQGKSGNKAPDHKEQDGRSNVGRQGMAVGETAAGSGTIGEGDKNIEARRTEEPMQSVMIYLSGEADTKATGGGKLGTGKADAKGMGGGAERVDSMEPGSNAGMAALMARQADALYAKASMKNVRVDSLKNASHELRQAADAIAKGNIEQMREFRKMAISSLSRAAANLSISPSSAMEATGTTGALDNMIQSGPDYAPPKYRNKVAEYYKALNSAL
jgi:hypothetical protein